MLKLTQKEMLARMLCGRKVAYNSDKNVIFLDGKYYDSNTRDNTWYEVTQDLVLNTEFVKQAIKEILL